jgi:uncharacterized protein YabN with tetrapyrrole methylase and pyrophosphatase domain
MNHCREEVLKKLTEIFRNVFDNEDLIISDSKDIKEMDLEDMDSYWEKAKSILKK